MNDDRDKYIVWLKKIRNDVCEKWDIEYFIADNNAKNKVCSFKYTEGDIDGHFADKIQDMLKNYCEELNEMEDLEQMTLM